MKDKLGLFLEDILGLKSQDKFAILERFKEKQLAKNDFLLCKNEVCRYIYFVDKGSVRTFFVNDNEQEATQYVAFENEITTSFNSFITQTPSNEFLQTTEKTNLLAINYSYFRLLFGKISILNNWK